MGLGNGINHLDSIPALITEKRVLSFSLRSKSTGVVVNEKRVGEALPAASRIEIQVVSRTVVT